MLVSIVTPDWVSFRTRTDYGTDLYRRIGLHQSCTNLADPQCTTFPDAQLCTGEERSFCDMWRTIGFLANVSAIIHFAGLVALVVVIAGARYQRKRGWPVVSGLLGVAALAELVIVGVAAYLYDHDEQFAVAG